MNLLSFNKTNPNLTVISFKENKCTSLETQTCEEGRKKKEKENEKESYLDVKEEERKKEKKKRREKAYLDVKNEERKKRKERRFEEGRKKEDLKNEERKKEKKEDLKNEERKKRKEKRSMWERERMKEDSGIFFFFLGVTYSHVLKSKDAATGKL